ncbi:MAG: lysozyme, partial [Burkholderiales bacterium]
VLARNLMNQDERQFQASLPGAELYPEEFDLYMDFVGQYGITNWRSSSMRREILAGNYVAACHALLMWRKAAGFDCSTLGNKRCAGVWTRQLERHKKCLEAQ